MPELAESLADRGFRTVEDAGLPGGWATDTAHHAAVRRALDEAGYEGASDD